jgi:RNA polymerase sigma-70 factor, ECF subfamily
VAGVEGDRTVPLGEVIYLSDRHVELAERSSDDLMTLARGGVREAFATLVGRHAARLVEFAVKMTGDRRTGEDVAQESWLAVWAARERYRPAGQFEAFLFTIARNRCRNALRSRGRRREVVSDEPAEQPVTATAVDAILEREQQRRIHDAALELPEKLREAVLLRFVAGLDYPSISAAIGRNESTVRSRVFHGLRLLRELVEEKS